MKRLLIRMSVLAGVIVLGWIAIAQAQRGTKDPDQPVGGTPAAAAAEATLPTPTLVQANSVSPGPSASTLKADNPLRPAERLPGPLGVTALRAPGTVPEPGLAETTEPSAARLAVQAAQHDSASQPASGAPADPFARGLNNLKGFDQAATVAGGLAAGATPLSQGGAAPPRATTPLGPEPSAGAGPPPRVAATHGDARSGAPVGGPHGLPVDDSTDAGQGTEPAPFKLDRSAPSNSLAPARPLDRPSSGDPARTDLAPSQDAAVGGEPAGPALGKPGAAQLEGPQSPALSVEKIAPPEIQVGKPAIFQTKIRNTGAVTAHGVELRDQTPKGTRLLGTTPRASLGADGELLWSLGTLKAGEEIVVQMQLMPTEEGEIGSVATVRFNAEASVRTIATRPELSIRAAGPGQVLIGEEAVLTISVSNPGTGVASGVVLEAKIPQGLRHPAGAELEYEVGDLRPKETRQLELRLTSVQAGVAPLTLGARGEANLKAESLVELDVVAPRLDVALEGPKRRFLEREATYVVSISNAGTAPARRVELTCELPPGLEFVSASNSGQFEPSSRSVHWLLEELPVKETGKVELITVPLEPGQKKLVLRGAAERGVAVEKEQPILIEGIAAVQFSLVDTADPIERGGETSYEVRVVNQGSKAATNVRLTILLPPEMRAVAAEGPTRHQVEGSRVAFEGLGRLAPKAETTYRVRVQGLQPGDLRIRAQLQTDEIQTPVTKEESTRVFSDE